MKHKHRGDKLDLLSRFVEYHEQLGECYTMIEQLKLFAEGGNQNSSSSSDVRFHLHHRLQEHFTFEDQVLFPTLMGDRKYLSLKEALVGFSEEHRQLLLFTGRAAPYPEPTHELNGLLQFRAELKKHADQERQRLVPLVENDVSLRFLIGRRMVAAHGLKKKGPYLE